MKSYTITVNGTAYEVTVEETGSVSASAAAPKAAPKAAPAAAPKAAAPAAGAGAVKVTASVPGKVVKVAASVGQAVKAGDSVIILESMKMEIPYRCLRTFQAWRADWQGSPYGSKTCPDETDSCLWSETVSGSCSYWQIWNHPGNSVGFLYRA